MKHFKPQVFLYVFLFLAMLTAFGFVAVFGIEEGTLPPTLFWRIGEKLFFILRFPTHTILEVFVLKGGWFVFTTGLLLNCLLYAFISERLYSLFIRKNN